MAAARNASIALTHPGENGRALCYLREAMTPSELDVRHGFVTVNGARCHYAETGGSGPMVVVLHGFPESWWSWRHQLAPLARAGYRVVAPDLRGANESEGQGPYELDTLASDVAQLISSLGASSAHVVGHGWGGAVAWQLAAAQPSLVDSLTVLSCPHPSRLLATLRENPSLWLRALPFVLSAIPVLPAQALRLLGPRMLSTVYRRSTRFPAHLSESELGPFAETLRRSTVAKAFVGWHRAALKSGIAGLWREPSAPVVQARTLMVWGKDDPLSRYDLLVPGTEALAPRLQVVLVALAGHFVHAERPEQVNTLLLRFLESKEVAAPGEEGVSVVASSVEARAPAPEAGSGPAARQTQTPVFTVVLSDPGENKIAVIKEIRDITGLAVKGARDLVEGAPRVIKTDISPEEAERIRQQLVDVGATVELRH